MLLDNLAILLGVLLGISEHTIHIGFIVFFIMVASHFFFPLRISGLGWLHMILHISSFMNLNFMDHCIY
jgi:hypothetical protein